MATFTLPGSHPSCPIHLPKDGDTLSEVELLSFPAFKNWISTLQHSMSLQMSNKSHTFHASPYTLRKIEIQSIDRFHGGRLGFVKLKADVRNDNDETLPGSVLLRGGSVAMMIVLQADDVPADTETDKYVILTIQPRVPAGALALAELPAGMLDDSGSFGGGAAKEIEEETGLKVPSDQLVDMTALALSPSTSTNNGRERNGDDGGEKLQNALYTSPGGCDEFMPIFLHERRVARAELVQWTGKLTGLREQGEKITLRLVRLEELWRAGARDAKCLAAWALYAGLKGEGKI